MATAFDSYVGMLPASPTVWWKCIETSGTSFADSSGNGNTGTLIGTATPVYSVAGPTADGGAIQFTGGTTGTGNAIQTSATMPILGANPQSIFFFYQTTAATTQGLVAFSAAENPPSGSATPLIGMNASGLLEWTYYNSGTKADAVATNDGNWHSCALVFPGGVGSEAVCYRDGQQVNLSAAITSPANVTGYWTFGATTTSLSANFWNGALGQFLFWQAALNPGQIAQLHAYALSALLFGQASYNGLTIGPGTPFQWNTIDGFTGLSAVRAGNVPRPQAQGMLGGYDFAGERTVTFNLEVVATPGGNSMQQNLNQARQAFQPVVSIGGGVNPYGVNAFEWSLGEVVSGVTAGLNRFMTARCEKFDVPVDMGWIAQGGGIANVAVQMSAIDPVIYDGNLQSLSLAASGSANVDNWGSAACFPVVTINGPSTSPVVTNTVTGQSVGSSLTLTSGQSLVIDMWAGSMTLAGVNQISTFTPGSAFWGLVPGLNTVSFTETSGSGTASVQYRNAFL